ncbi:MAG TPA: NADP-dependent malic enzyme [Kiloniellales bacterium]|nr:NADP-dependent malic enzyme [Kiloniellales bacterium]
MADDTSDPRKAAALAYHRLPKPGKLEIAATKPLGTQRDLSLAYSPGVAAASEAIVADPEAVFEVTSRGNLVAVVTNGTAVLGLGSIGALAAKPVMEGKAVLFKKFAGIDCFDIEVDERDVAKLCDVIAALEPTFGGINLEDIKAPECFEVERNLRQRMKIPVFHDDQHGTAIIVGAAVLNGLSLVGKEIGKVKMAVSGAGAAALACLDLLVSLGVRRENIWVHDIEGLVYEGRTSLMDPWKARYAQPSKLRSLGDTIEGADIFLGLSAPRVLKPEWLAKMKERPLVFALANPTPEIMPEEAKAARPDAIIATGRSDYPNQVNNVLCFPFIFRGALDVGATVINEEMKLAAVRALAQLARAIPSEVVQNAYGGEQPAFGPDYIIPRPFDPRLMLEIAPAVAKAAMDSGVARRPVGDFAAYRQRLEEFVYRSGLAMKPVFIAAKGAMRRVIYTDGEDERVLRAAQVVIDERLARPILIGRPEVVGTRAKRLGLRARPGEDFELINPASDPRYDTYWGTYHSLLQRQGITPDTAKALVRTSSTVIASLAVRLGDADAMLAGPTGRYHRHLEQIRQVIGRRPGVRELSALSLLILPKGQVFIADTFVTPNPTAEGIVEMTLLAAEQVRRFGLEPKVALLSHSAFGSSEDESARKMRLATSLLHAEAPDLEVEGEMHGDAALNEEIRHRVFPASHLRGAANLLIMPNLDAANIAFTLLRSMGEGLSVGPILVGAAASAHIVTPSVTARGIVNMTAIAAAEATALAERGRG